MNRFFILIAIVLSIAIIYHLYVKKRLKSKPISKVELGLISLGVVFVVLAATGRAPALFAAIGAAMTQLMRLAPLAMKHAPWLRQILTDRFAGEGAGPDSTGPSGQQLATSNDLTIVEAREILGVDESADKETIINAHRSIVSKIHPDKGGSNYLTTKANLAKDILLYQWKDSA